MDSTRKKVFQGIISQQEYRNIAIQKTIENLVKQNFQFVELLGQGSFGSVIEVKCQQTRQSLAAKIVLQEFVSVKEIENWPLLKHKNLLPLLESFHLPEAYTYTFLMPKYPIALDHQLQNPNFRCDIKGLERAITWIQDTHHAISYLRERNFCHLDIKCDNVLISETDSAILCDFGFLTLTKGPVEEYGSPDIYRPPEAQIKGTVRTPVNGYSYDVWTMGLLALEVFSGLHIVKSSMKWKEFSWESEVYNTIYDMIQDKEFKNHLEKAFPVACISSKKVKIIQNFIMECIALNPKDRSKIEELLQCKMFGGKRKSPTNHTPNVWGKKATPKDMKNLVDIYSIQTSEECFSKQETEVTTSAHDDTNRNSFNNHVPSRRYRLKKWASEKKRSIIKTFTGLFLIRRLQSRINIGYSILVEDDVN